MATAQQSKTASELRQAIFFNRRELERLNYLLERLKQYEFGSARYVETQDKYLRLKQELEVLHSNLQEAKVTGSAKMAKNFLFKVLIILSLLFLATLSY